MIFNKFLKIFKADKLMEGLELSYTKVNAYQACPFKYKLLFVDGWRIGPNPYIALGLSVHRALEAFYKKQGKTAEALLESFDDNWLNEGFESPQQVLEFYEKGQNMLKNYWEIEKTSGSATIFLEKTFEMPIGKNRLFGTIDRIDQKPGGTYEIIDYKTHSQLWPQEKVDNDLQLSLYAFAADKVFSLKPLDLKIYFLAHGVKIKTTRTSAQIDSALNYVNTVAEKILNKSFEPNLEHCLFCDFKNKCAKSKAVMSETAGKE
jgi:putative RecB family exonuclease